jgi:hypothetical protein
MNYFQDLFTAGPNLEVDRSMAALEKKGTPQMNARLLAAFNV